MALPHAFGTHRAAPKRPTPPPRVRTADWYDGFEQALKAGLDRPNFVYRGGSQHTMYCDVLAGFRAGLEWLQRAQETRA